MSSRWQEIIDVAIADRADRLSATRRHLHMHPEPSGQEQKSTAFLAGCLAESGLLTRTGPEDRGLIVDQPAPASGPLVALRADIDALWIEDCKQVDYRSQTAGVMHACGHDAHAATALGALWALRSLEESGEAPWPLRYRGVFQPAEETGEGAFEMIAAGALEGVGAILGLHMDPSRAAGRVGIRNGPLTASCDDLEIRVEGRGGHAARPHESIDPIAAAAQLISSIYLFVPRGVDSHDPVVVTIGQVIAGGSPNAIPAEVVLRGTVRTLSRAVRAATKDHIRKLARGVAEASGTTIAASFSCPIDPVVNDHELAAILRRAAADALGAENIEEIPRPSMGGEDFANYLEHAPGCMFRLGCAGPTAGGAPLHSPMFDVDERALAAGARILARAVVQWCDPHRAA